MSSILSSPTSSVDGKKRKTKLEKIAELESRIKILKEENNRLKKKNLQQQQQLLSGSSDNFGGETGDFSCSSPSFNKNNKDDGWDSLFILDSPSPSERSSHRVSLTNGSNNGDIDKLKEALKAMKRVTVKQEMTLSNMRQKAKQRRQEIEYKDQKILKLQNENKAFRIAHEKIRRLQEHSNDQDIATLRGRIADLELKLAKEETSNEEQYKKLKESQDGITNLQSQLAGVSKGRGVDRNFSGSNASVTSFMSDSTAGEDIAKLKRELAKKTEKIANLQHELEVARDVIHDMRQRHEFNASFPLTPPPGSSDFFDDDDDDDKDFWSK
jgi:hypothetical protein